MQRINFDLGESRHVKLLIKSASNEAFTIRNASWELIKDAQTESNGTCTIEDHVIDSFVTPQSGHTVYKLKVIYEIADETLIEIIEVAVT